MITIHSTRARILLVFVLPPLAFLALLFFYPVAKVLTTSVTDPELGLGNYRLLIENPALRRVFFTTLRIAGTTTLIATAIGYLIAHRMHNADARELRIIVFLLMFPLWTSVLVRAFAWVMLLQRNGPANDLLLALSIVDQRVPLVRNEFGVLVGMVHVMIPYATLPIYSAMSAIDPRLHQAARSLGATPWQIFARVFFPLTLPGIGAALIIVFITSMGFYVTPIVLGGGKVVMVAEYVSIQITETLRWGLGTMLATTLLAIVLLVVIGFRRLTILRQDRAAER